MAFNPRTINKELDFANLAKHNDNYADIKTELDAHNAHIAAQTAHGSTADATPGAIMQRDSEGRAKVAAPAAADDIARKAEVDAVQEALDDHIDDADVHLSEADRDKLDGIEAGAEPNQNAFAQVNNVVAASESDTLTIAGGTGITVTTNPTTKTVTVTATGEATPGPHGSSHDPDGSDPIPELVALRSEFDALTPASIGAETPAGAQAKVDALAGEGNTKTVAEVAEDVAGVTAQLADVMNQTINVKSPPPPLVAAVGDGITDDTAALTGIFSYARENRIPIFIPAGTYKTSEALDVSGLDICGVLSGFNNQSGTIISGNGDHVLLTQLSTDALNITYSIRNLGLSNGATALKMTYAVNCVVENVFVTNDCVDGFEVGDATVLGTLWNNFRNCRVDVSGTALKINGLNFSNANVFDTCFFRGGEAAAIINCASGIGAVSNQFINTEFAGAKTGITLIRTRSTSLINCYFESSGPSVVIDGSTWDLILSDAVFAGLNNTNDTGVNSFIWHKSGTCRMSIVSGYVYLPAGTSRDNLNFIKSDAVASFLLTMLDPPEREVYSNGFSLFAAGLPNKESTLIYQSSYTPEWTTSGASPSLGNGTLTGSYSLNGRICTVQVELVAGSTTTFGSGQFQISLPIPASARAQGIARIFDSGTTMYVGLVEVPPGASNAVFYTNNSPNLVQSNSPMTWTQNDALRFTITYEI